MLRDAATENKILTLWTMAVQSCLISSKICFSVLVGGTAHPTAAVHMIASGSYQGDGSCQVRDHVKHLYTSRGHNTLTSFILAFFSSSVGGGALSGISVHICIFMLHLHLLMPR